MNLLTPNSPLTEKPTQDPASQSVCGRCGWNRKSPEVPAQVLGGYAREEDLRAGRLYGLQHPQHSLNKAEEEPAHAQSSCGHNRSARGRAGTGSQLHGSGLGPDVNGKPTSQVSQSNNNDSLFLGRLLVLPTHEHRRGATHPRDLQEDAEHLHGRDAVCRKPQQQSN